MLARAGVPTGMLFVRSLNGGVSHSPDELSSAEDVELAIDVLAGSAHPAGLAHPCARGHEARADHFEQTMSCAPCQSTSSPIAGRCSTPSTTVAKWLPASCPALLAKHVSP